MTYYPIIISLIIILLTGCSHSYDPELVHLNAIAGSDPEKALQQLDSIDAGTLSAADRHFYDFLTVKITDKNYRKHVSDSLILDVIANLPYNGDKNLQAEALYYGGRVYSDWGDYPRAIQYFQDALEMLPDNADLNLRANMLSQTGRLLNKLRLNDEAVSYLEKVIAIDRQLKDTVNLVYDLQLLGHINLNASNITIAEKCFKEALSYCRNLPSVHAAKTKMYLAETKRRTGRIDSALIYIRNIVNEVAPSTRNLALSYSTEIYKDAGKFDSAYIHAKQLVESEDDLNKQTGYYILLSPEIRPYSSPEDINRYFNEYRHTIESIYDDNKNQLAIEQISRYNYDLQQRARLKAEQVNHKFKYLLTVSGAIILGLIFLSIFLYRRSLNNQMSLVIAQKELRKKRLVIENLKDQIDQSTLAPVTKSEQELREELRERILLQYESTEGKDRPLHDNLLQSDVLNSLRSYIRQEKSISNNDSLWRQLKNCVEENYPSFKPHLVRLTAGKLTEDEYRTALLIKCGVKTTQLTKLLDITKSGIMSRRLGLSIKMFDRKISTNALDSIIRSL